MNEEDLDILIFPENIDFSAICRTCLGSDSLCPIFPNSRDHKSYSTVILITMGVKVQKDDGLPQQMCGHCIYYLNNSMSFRKKCKDAEERLLQAKKESDLNVDIKIETCNIDNVDDSKNNMEFEEAKSSLDSDFVLKSEIDIDVESIVKEQHQIAKRRKLSTDSEDTKERVRCVVCNKELSLKSLNTHMMLSHPGADEQRVKCKFCNKNIVKEKMNRHLKMMHASKRYQCEHCNSMFQSRNSLVEHLNANCVSKKKRRKISEKSREMTECEVCHKRMQRASLRMHVKILHAGLGPVCEHCGRRFGNRHRLAEHLRAKHGYEKFRCSSCEFSCSSTVALENHERRHRGEKPFVCEACGAKFHAAYLLAQHRKSHTTERTVQCPSCPAVFKTTNALSAHRVSVHGAARHRCPVCAKCYSCRHYAVKHLRAVHLFQGTIPPLQVLPKSSEL